MPYVALVTVLALCQFIWFGVQVARARGKYGIKAPATTGHEIFDRHFRVAMNTLEQLIVFLPALWIFARFVSPVWAAALGAVFIVGRAIYGVTYVRNPASRSLGFALTMLPMMAMLLGIAIWAVHAIVSGAAM